MDDHDRLWTLSLNIVTTIPTTITTISPKSDDEHSKQNQSSVWDDTHKHAHYRCVSCTLTTVDISFTNDTRHVPTTCITQASSSQSTTPTSDIVTTHTVTPHTSPTPSLFPTPPDAYPTSIEQPASPPVSSSFSSSALQSIPHPSTSLCSSSSSSSSVAHSCSPQHCTKYLVAPASSTCIATGVQMSVRCVLSVFIGILCSVHHVSVRLMLRC